MAIKEQQPTKVPNRKETTIVDAQEENIDWVQEPYHVHSGADQPKITQTQIINRFIELTNLSATPPLSFDPNTGTISIQLGSGNQLLGMNSGGTVVQYRTLTGTANQITISNLTFSTPQDIAPTSTFTMGGLTNNGSLRVKRTAVSTDPYSVVAADYYLGVDTSTIAIEIDLPSAASNSGRVLVIKDEAGNASANNITIDGNGGDDIDGLNTQTISTDYGSMTIVSDGADWFIIAQV